MAEGAPPVCMPQPSHQSPENLSHKAIVVMYMRTHVYEDAVVVFMSEQSGITLVIVEKGGGDICFK